jgi:hypothetical protein
MKKKIFVFGILIISFLNCTTKVSQRNNFERANCTIVNVDEFEYVYRFQAIRQIEKDTVYVLSWKEKMFEKYKIKPLISSNKSLDILPNLKYTFVIDRMRARVSTMQQLGQYFIVEKDTLWAGKSEVPAPKYYIAKNTVGLKIW